MSNLRQESCSTVATQCCPYHRAVSVRNQKSLLVRQTVAPTSLSPLSAQGDIDIQLVGDGLEAGHVTVALCTTVVCMGC